jgi:vacuolar-type H+-ATPase subunit H
MHRFSLSHSVTLVIQLNCSLKKTSETLAEIKKAEEKARAECEAVRNEHEAFKLEQKAKMNAQVAKYSAQLQSLRESYNSELYNGQKLKDIMEEREIHHVCEIRKYKKGTIATICLATLAVAIASGIVHPSQIRDQLMAHAVAGFETAVESTRDSMCGPVPNGFAVPNNSFTLDAPWWAPEGKKEQWFALCGDRTRSRMHWDWINSKLSAYALEKSGRANRLWTLRVPDARVSKDKIYIETKDGKLQRELVAPWAA